MDRPDTRQKTDRGCQQGPFTGSDLTGVSLGLGTHKRMYPFIFIIKVTHEIVMALTYASSTKAFYSNLDALLTHSSNALASIFI